MDQPHIMIVEDDPLVGRMLGIVLDQRGYRTATLADPRDVAPFLAEHAVDLILLDVTLPSIDGLTLCIQLRRADVDIPVIFLSAHAAAADRVEGLACGADDYLIKPFEPRELVARVEAVLRRCRRTARDPDGPVIVAGDNSLDLGNLQYTVPGHRPVALTPTEAKLLAPLMLNANAVVARAALIERVWGYNCATMGNRLDVYIGRLRGKIEDDPTDPATVRTIVGRGYLFRATRRARAVAESLTDRTDSACPDARGGQVRVRVR